MGADPPRAVKRFLREVRDDPGLSEVVAPSSSRPLPFALDFDGSAYRLVRVHAAPAVQPARPRFGEPGPWLIVYQPDGERVIQAVRLPREEATHLESIDAQTRRPRAVRLNPRTLRRGLTLSIVDGAQIFLGDQMGSAKQITTPRLEMPSTEAMACPASYRIAGTSDPRESLNILVVSAGFPDGELDVFRCAAHRMFSQLLASATPFGDQASSINVFRIDLADTDSRSLGERFSCQASPVNWNARIADCSDTVAIGGAAWNQSAALNVLPTTIALAHEQGSTGVCGVVFPNADGFNTLADVVACVPGVEIDAVVVLINSGAYFGGGNWQTTPPTAVVSLNQVADPTEAWYLLAHELGHALGLLDEYEDGTGLPDTPDRNVAFTAFADPVWRTHCQQTAANTATCGAATPNGACEVFCQPSPCAGCCTGCAPSRAGAADTGLWEGAQYHSCGYFRSRQLCLMRENPSLAPLPRVFCKACEDWMTAEIGRLSKPTEETFATYLGGEAVESGFGGGPHLYNVPGSGGGVPVAWKELRALVRTKFGVALLTPDRIDAFVRRLRSDGRAAKCHVSIDGAGPMRCMTECRDEPPTDACSLAIEALVSDQDRLERAKAFHHGRKFPLAGIRLREPGSRLP